MPCTPQRRRPPARRPSRILALVPLVLALPLTPAWAGDVDYTLSGVAQGGGVWQDPPGARQGRWDAVGGYGLTGGLSTQWDATTYGATVRVGSGDYGKSVDRPGTNAPAALEEAFLSAAGDWGKVRLGQTQGAAARATDLLPLLVGGEMDGFWTRETKVRAPGLALGSPILARDSADAPKIGYETSRLEDGSLSGLKLGVSVAPQRRALGQDLVSPSLIAAEGDFWEAGANYRGDWGPWSYELGLAANHATAARAGLNDTNTQTLALGLTYGGFTWGTVLFNDGQSGLAGTAPAGREKPGATLGMTTQGTYENGPYAMTLFWHASATGNVTQYRAFGAGWQWKWRRDTTVGLDLARWSAQRIGTALPGAPNAGGGMNSDAGLYTTAMNATGLVASGVVEFRF